MRNPYILPDNLGPLLAAIMVFSVLNVLVFGYLILNHLPN